MPKILIYITKRWTWLFLFFGTDFHENRAHVHVGKKGMNEYCKIWLEPQISVARKGELTESQIKKILAVVKEHHESLMTQWRKFKKGENIKMLTVKE